MAGAALDSESAAEKAGKWLGAISTLTGATTLAATFGISFSPDHLIDKTETFVKAGLLTSIALVAISIVFAALASSRLPVKSFWTNPTLAKVEEQDHLKGIRQKVIISQILAALAGIVFITALGFSIFADKDPSLYLYTASEGTPGAEKVVCGELDLEPTGQAITVRTNTEQQYQLTNQKTLAEFDDETCPATEAE